MLYAKFPGVREFKGHYPLSKLSSRSVSDFLWTLTLPIGLELPSNIRQLSLLSNPRCHTCQASWIQYRDIEPLVGGVHLGWRRVPKLDQKYRETPTYRGRLDSYDSCPSEIFHPVLQSISSVIRGKSTVWKIRLQPMG